MTSIQSLLAKLKKLINCRLFITKRIQILKMDLLWEAVCKNSSKKNTVKLTNQKAKSKLFRNWKIWNRALTYQFPHFKESYSEPTVRMQKMQLIRIIRMQRTNGKRLKMKLKKRNLFNHLQCAIFVMILEVKSMQFRLFCWKEITASRLKCWLISKLGKKRWMLYLKIERILILTILFNRLQIRVHLLFRIS